MRIRITALRMLPSRTHRTIPIFMVQTSNATCKGKFKNMAQASACVWMHKASASVGIVLYGGIVEVCSSVMQKAFNEEFEHGAEQLLDASLPTTIPAATATSATATTVATVVKATATIANSTATIFLNAADDLLGALFPFGLVVNLDERNPRVARQCVAVLNVGGVAEEAFAAIIGLDEAEAPLVPPQGDPCRLVRYLGVCQRCWGPIATLAKASSTKAFAAKASTAKGLSSTACDLLRALFSFALIEDLHKLDRSAFDQRVAVQDI
eukprot:CAMPEP_0119298894 /NCGR_PEP_ID=MMETSP1333-20130426/1027_1 /TAXON_ID=418940 /ORGANISM="Scyphosphaera apsteinii, Strain RCC1455" /LENGTH=266 /DNA_ID=CAMNT_0007300125 /DNA_START=302 /DNA_END=1103 /DNA_ORIENTATION=-